MYDLKKYILNDDKKLVYRSEKKKKIKAEFFCFKNDKRKK